MSADNAYVQIGQSHSVSSMSVTAGEIRVTETGELRITGDGCDPPSNSEPITSTTAFKIGVGIGAGMFLIILLLALFLFVPRLRNKCFRKETSDTPDGDTTRGSVSLSAIQGMLFAHA